MHNELISDEKQILKKIGILELSNIQTELNSKIKRIEEIQKLIKALFESKYNGEVTENDFKILSKKYFDEREEIQKSVNLLTAEVNKRSKKIKGTIEIINYVKNMSENEMATPTQELCNKLIEKIIIGEFCGFGEINFGKQQVDIYLYDVGRIGDIVDVAYKTYEERVKAVLPEVIKSGKFSVKKICEAVGIEQHILRDGLKREGLTFKDFKKID